MSTPAVAGSKVRRDARDAIVIRFSGDSGDGMQLTGTQFTMEAALSGSDLSTFPDYPAEIRAPAGTTFGVSSFQIHFGSTDIMTPGDELDVLVAMNPAALTVNIQDLRVGGLVVVDTSGFTSRNISKAGFESNPLEGDLLNPYQVMPLDIATLTAAAVADFGLSSKEALRSRNMWALGLMLWMYGRGKQATVDWLQKKFAKAPAIAQANIAALNAGHAYGETAELPEHLSAYSVTRADLPPGVYRTVNGADALAFGLIAGVRSVGIKQLFFGSYPITPASTLLHALANLRPLGVVTFQAEDEIAAICSAIGASYAGALGVTSSSGPGLALKTEAMGLAVSTELPLVIVNSQRAGPSTGMPTKAEQSDLFQAMYGRNGEAPVVILAAATPADCFEMAMEAVRLAVGHMTPVILLSDGYLASAAEPWLVPDLSTIPVGHVQYAQPTDGFHPFQRDPKSLARVWPIPGTPGVEHRIGGLEKSYASGNISYDSDNHAKMTRVRADKIARVADDIPLQQVDVGQEKGRLLVVGWGSTYGPIRQAVLQSREDEGLDVSFTHLRYLNPFPRNLSDLLRGFDRILVPEQNTGQLTAILRSTYLVDAQVLSKVTGKPFMVSEIRNAISVALKGGEPS
jgi:2-oxoglutarate ferredoxin oxidoreductase subunit alpha